MSTNDYNWNSCMDWTGSGEYRRGTVEMMNSPMVICAYLKSDVQQMHFNGYEWPSKKWRAWIVVNKDAILCNRNYPYTNDNLAKVSFKVSPFLASKTSIAKFLYPFCLSEDKPDFSCIWAKIIKSE